MSAAFVGGSGSLQPRVRCGRPWRPASNQKNAMHSSLGRPDTDCATQNRGENGVSVRRAKVSLFSGCKSRPATFALAGSNRSGDGSNDIAEAIDAKDRQAVPRAGRP
jgi:hypothetical protein